MDNTVYSLLSTVWLCSLLLLSCEAVGNNPNENTGPTSTIPTHAQLFELPEFINTIIDERILPIANKEARLKALLDLVYKENQLNLQYANDITRTPREAIAHRKGNCVTLSFTFAAMARRAQLKTYFMESRDPGRWRQIGENYALERHMSLYLPMRSSNARGYNVVNDHSQSPQSNRSSNTRGYHVDFQYAEPSELRHKKMSDKRAISDYYSNRAIESLLINKLDLALEFSRQALSADNNYDASWLNYGLILRRRGNIEEAINAYKQAKKINPKNLSIYNNLAVAYKTLGDIKSEARMIKKIKNYRLKNPFYLATLGRIAIQHKQYDSAINWFEKAIKRDKSIALFYLSLSEAFYLNEQLEQAIKTLKRGQKRATQANIKSRLHYTLEFLKHELLSSR